MVKDKISKKSSTAVTKVKKSKKRFLKPLFAIGRYFKGSWMELKEVRWPDRKATWGMTAAVLGFTGFFIALIVLLDLGFSQLFNLIIK